MLLANDNSAVLYQDEFCKLTEDILTIKRYFFGTLKPKEVRLTQIRVVYFEEQKTAAGKYAHRRVWGKGVNTAAAAEDKKIPVYWAADLRRCLPGEKHDRSDVIIDTEDGMLKGFTVADAQHFLGLLRLYGPMSTIIVDNLNI